MPSFQRERSLGHLMNWAARLFRKDIRQRLQPLGLLPAHIPVLLALAEEEQLSQTELGRWSQTEQPTMTALLIRMEKLNLVTRSTDPRDRRVCLFGLTDYARSKLPEFYVALEEGNARATALLSQVQSEQMINALHLIIGAFGQEARSILSPSRSFAPADSETGQAGKPWQTAGCETDK